MWKCTNRWVSLFYNINCDECLNDKGCEGETLRDVLIHVGIKLNFHFRIENHFHGLAMFATYTQKMQTFFFCHACLILRHWPLLSLASVYTLNDSRHKKRQNANFSNWVLRTEEGEQKKLKILFYPNFVFFYLFYFSNTIFTLLSIRMRKEKCAFSVSTGNGYRKIRY